MSKNQRGTVGLIIPIVILACAVAGVIGYLAVRQLQQPQALSPENLPKDRIASWEGDDEGISTDLEGDQVALLGTALSAAFPGVDLHLDTGQVGGQTTDLEGPATGLDRGVTLPEAGTVLGVFSTNERKARLDLNRDGDQLDEVLQYACVDPLRKEDKIYKQGTLPLLGVNPVLVSLGARPATDTKKDLTTNLYGIDFDTAALEPEKVLVVFTTYEANLLPRSIPRRDKIPCDLNGNGNCWDEIIRYYIFDNPCVPKACPRDCQCLAKTEEFPLCRGEETICEIPKEGPIKYCYERPVEACPTDCECLTESEASERGMVDCQDKVTVCERTPEVVKYCYKEKACEPPYETGPATATDGNSYCVDCDGDAPKPGLGMIYCTRPAVARQTSPDGGYKCFDPDPCPAVAD